MKLSVKVTVVVLAGTLLVAAAISIQAYRFTAEALQRTTGQGQVALAEQTMAQISALLHERYINMQANAGELAFAEILRNPRRAIPREYLDRIRDLTNVTGPWNKLFVVDVHGTILLSSDEALIGRPITDEPHRGAGFAAALQGQAYHSDFFQFDDTKKFAVFYAAPVRDAQSPKQPIIGAVMGGFSWQAIEEIIDDVPTAAVLINRDGLVIADHADPQRNGFNRPLAAALWQQGGLPTQRRTTILSAVDSLTHVPALLTHVPERGHLAYSPNGWHLLLETPLTVALATATKSTLQLVLVLIPALFLMAGLIVWLILRLIVRPLAALTHTVQIVAAGDLSQRAPPGAPDEIGALTTAFNRMLDHLNDTTVSKEWFEVMLGSIGDAVIATDCQSRVTFLNAEAERLTGWTAAEAVHRQYLPDIFRIVNEHTRAPVDNPLTTVIRDGSVVGLANHTLLIHRDGSERPIDDSGAPIRDKHGTIIGAILVFRDISDRKKSELLLNAQHTVTQVLANSATLADAAPHIIAAICDNLGWQIGIIWQVDLAANHLRCVDVWHTPGLHAEAFIRLSRETRFLAGQGLPGRVWAGNIPAWIPDVVQDTNFPRAPIAAQVGLHGAFAFPFGLDNEVLGIIEFFSPEIRQPDNDLLQMMGVIGRQIGQFIRRKRAEEENTGLELQLLHAHKLESIGQLAAGIAHEINTPIQYIGDNTRFLQQSFHQLLTALQPGTTGSPPPDMAFLCTEIPSAIAQSLDGIAHVSNIVKAMKEFSHPGVHDKTPVDLNRALDTTLAVSRNEWKLLATIETDFEPTLPLVPCLPNEMNQVFLNLIVNAAHAIGETADPVLPNLGVIHLQTRCDGAWVEIRIADTGGGIPDTIRNRIFDPFFTTKEVGKGTGQGLAIARSVIVDKHQGTLTFDSTPGVGTTFIIRIPLGL